MKARAFSSISSREVATSWTSPFSRARCGVYWVPWSSTLSSASAMPMRRTVRVTPPPAGSRPRVTSGRPMREPGASRAMRWWEARAIS